jgi:hypothetical protein
MIHLPVGQDDLRAAPLLNYFWIHDVSGRRLTIEYMGPRKNETPESLSG